MVKKYIKKRIAIEAIKFENTEETISKILEFCGKENIGKLTIPFDSLDKAELEILTLEDGFDNRVKHIATEGDFIIKGIDGEFYPCKPEIFYKTYDEYED